MEDPNSTLLPYILETLSRTPELCDTFENLCKNVHKQLVEEQSGRYANVRLAIQKALNVGQSLGIITLNNECIRVPFNFRQNKNYRNMNHYDLNEAQPIMGSDLVGVSQQQQNAANKPQQSGRRPEKKSNKKQEGEEQKKTKYNKQLDLEESDFSLDSVPSDRDRFRGRSRSGTRSGTRSSSRRRSNSRSNPRKSSGGRRRYQRRR